MARARRTPWSRVAWAVQVAFALTGLLLALPADAAISEDGSALAAGLSGTNNTAPGAEVVIFSVGLVGDGTDFVTQVRVQLDDLSSATGIAASEISELRLYESTDASFGGDSQIANQTTVNVNGTNTSLLGAGSAIPNATTYHYFVTAILNTTVTEGHAFRLGFGANNVITNDTFVGTAVTAADADNVTIEVTGTQLALTTAPADGDVFDTGNDEVVSGATFDTQPVVTVRDANNNVDLNFSENIEASLTGGSGSLSGTTSVAPSSGVATFTNLTYTAASDGEGFQITFDDAAGGADPTSVTTAGGLSADAIATQIAFTQQPAGAANGAALTTQPQVTARDANGLTDTDFTDTITLSSSGSGTLTNETLAATAGVATFTSFQYTTTVDQASITITADDAAGGSGGDLGSVTSNSLTASAGAADRLDLSFDGSDIQADGSSTKTVTVIVQDATGLKRSTDSSTSVTLTVTGTGTGGGTKTVSGGEASFTVTASTSVGTVNLSATSSGLTGDSGNFNTANNAPTAVAQTVSATEDVDVTITLSGSDADGDAITFRVSTLPANGTLYQTADGSTRGSAITSTGTTVTDGSGRIIYVSAQDGNGSGHGTFGFQSHDGTATSSEATVTVNVTGTEDPPKAVDDDLTINEDATTDLSVLANDSDPDGDALTVTSATGAGHGSLSVNGDGTVRFVPQVNYFGSDAFDYTISDGNGNSATATVNLTITSVNDGPVAGDDFATTQEGARVRIAVLDNDSDLESASLGVVGTSIPERGGSASVTSGTWVDYVPAPGFYGEDTFTYTLKDGDGGTAIGRVVVTVERDNRRPVARDDAVEVTAADSLPVAIDVLANDSDPDGDAIRVTAVAPGPHTASVTFDDGSLAYRPVSLNGGTDILVYTIDDGFGGTDTAELTVTLERLNTPPEAANDSARVMVGESVEVRVLDNDTDADGDPLRVAGLVDADTAIVMADSSLVRVTPIGPDTIVFRYVASDGYDRDTAQVTVSAYANSPPEAAPDSAVVRRGGRVTVDVLANDRDVDGDSLEVMDVTAGEGTAEARLSGRGTVAYTARADYSGFDTVAYSVSDGKGGVGSGLLVVWVDANTDPVARRDSVSTGVGRTVRIRVLANDTDPDGDSLSVRSAAAGEIGAVEVSGRDVVYHPAADESGLDAFDYEVEDGKGGVATGTVVVLILTAPPPGDFDGDFQSSPEDVIPFAAAFGSTSAENGFDPAFDFNGNGIVDFFDFLAFRELWMP